ncbi:type II secretion system protein [Chloroflexota bacterium]
MRVCIKKLFRKKAGFTIIEVLVVVAILAILAVVVGVNFGKYIGQSKDEAYATEVQNIQIAVGAMIQESSAGQLDSAQSGINDADLVTADSGALVLTDYLKRIGEDGLIKTGCAYSFAIDGRVTQETP